MTKPTVPCQIFPALHLVLPPKPLYILFTTFRQSSFADEVHFCVSDFCCFCPCSPYSAGVKWGKCRLRKSRSRSSALLPVSGRELWMKASPRSSGEAPL